MIDFLKRFLGYPRPQPQPVAPYKIETPISSKCGCGRSRTGYCTGLHNLTDAQWIARMDADAVAPDKAK